MALDPYTPCPCGSGKKLKFCECSAESTELERVLVAIDGDQRVSALDQIERVLAKNPQQKAMLALAGIVKLQMDDTEGLKKAAERFAAIAPQNPVALGLQAIVDLETQRPLEAVAKVQKALAVSGNEVHYLIPETLFAIAQGLIYEGNIPAARAHLLLHLSLLGPDSEDRRGLTQLMKLNSADSVSLVEKQDFQLDPLADSPVWKEEYDAAFHDISHGQWGTAAKKLEALDKKHPAQAVVLRTLAIMQTYLADPAAGKTWSKYAHLPELSPDDALEAAMTAEALMPRDAGDEIAHMKITYAVKDSAKLLETAVSNKRLTKLPADLAKLVPEGTPPPRAAYYLLDRELPESGEGLTVDSVPRVVGEVLIFGKETDREARLEFFVTKTADLAGKVRSLQQVGDDCLGMIVKEEKLDTVSAYDEALEARWRLPDNTPPELQRSLMKEQYRRNALEIMPKFPQAVLDGRSPREVASDPAYRLRLLAHVRAFELDYIQKRHGVDFAEVRSSLGLPSENPLLPVPADGFKHMSILRYGRFDLTQASNEQLTELLRLSSSVGQVEAMLAASNEVIRRGGVGDDLPLDGAYVMLATISGSSEEAFAYLEQAKQVAVAAGRSPAQAMLVEFDLRIARREIEPALVILTALQTKHIREPGVAERVYQRLMNLGLIDPYTGQLRSMPGGAEDSASPLGAGPDPAAGSVWSPDAAPAASAQKSKLWVPGMD